MLYRVFKLSRTGRVQRGASARMTSMPKLLASFAIAGLCAVGSSLVLAADLPPSKRELVRDDERNCLCFGPWDRNLYRQVSLIGREHQRRSNGAQAGDREGRE